MECLLHARHSPYSCDKTNTVLPSGSLLVHSRTADNGKEMARHEYVPTGNNYQEEKHNDTTRKRFTG